MRLFNYGFLCSALLLGLVACNDDNPWATSEGTGGIAPKVMTDASVSDAIPTRSQAIAPDVAEFGLKLVKTDGTYSHTWDKIAAFPTDQAFESGEYTLQAFYGNETDEGYGKPYYSGTTSFSVKPGEVSEPSVTATLANSMIDVKYTDAFRNYFSDYTTSLHSEGYSQIELSNQIDDAVYIHPGNVKVTVAFTKPNGQSATVQPAEFVAEARHHYHITLDVNNGQVGDAQLLIKFDDSVVTEDVQIDLSDELLNVPGPEVTAKGFTSGSSVSMLEGAVPAEAKYAVYAPGVITSAVLTVESDNYTPAFGREVELVNADAALQNQLATAGVKCIGLFKNPDKLASVDIASFLAAIPAGNYRITLVVKDKLTRVNEPVTFVADCSPLTINYVSSQTSPFGSTTGVVTMAYNGSDLARDITVKGLDDNGIWVDCPITNVAAAAAKRGATRADAYPVKNYNVTLTIPNTTRDVSLKFYRGGKEIATGSIQRGAPTYTLSANSYARHCVITIGGQSGSTLANITNNIRFRDTEGKWLAESILTRDPEHGTVTVKSGLEPSTPYLFNSTALRGDNPTMGADIEFTTEAAAQPQNNAMENWYQTKAPHSQTVGFGADCYRVFCGTEGASLYWATRNETTTSVNSGPTPNYVSYSGTRSVAGVSGNAAEISSIGWGQANTFTVGEHGGTCKNVSAGMLFMGSHSYTGSTNFDASLETFNYGQPFTSRPVALTFDYKFAPYNNESFKAYVVLENRANGKTTEIARGELVSSTAQSSFVKATVGLKYSNITLKATHAYIVFISSTAASPGYKNVEGSKGAFQGYTDARKIGNVLTVDNIVFTY